MDDQRLLTPEQVGARLQLSVYTILDYLRHGHPKGGRLRGFKSGKQWRIRESDLQEFIERNMSNGDQPRPVLVKPPDPDPEPAEPASAAKAPMFSEQRREILALLQHHPEGLSPVQVRQRLGTEKDLGQIMKSMARDGWLRRLKPGVYAVTNTPDEGEWGIRG